MIGPMASRALALALAFAAPAALMFGVILPARDAVRAKAEAVEILADQVARFEDRAASAGRGGAIAIGEPALLDDPRPAVAAARLQDILNQTATRAGVSTTTVRVERPTVDEGLLRVEIDADLTADIDTLSRLLQMLETGSPYVFVREMAVRRGPDPEGGVQRLSVRLRLAAFAPADP